MYLTEENIDLDPFKQFDIWFKEAKDIGLKDPNAMNVASATKNGIPSSRMVLLKSYDENGFIFYTNYTSRKSKEIIDNPSVALNFFWDALERQVRVEGKVSKVDPKISDEYFSSRSRLSQLGAHASNQSEIIENYDIITSKLNELEKKYDGKKITNDILTQIMKDYKLGQSTILKINKYIEKPNLQNEKGLEKYIDMILTEKAEKK